MTALTEIIIPNADFLASASIAEIQERFVCSYNAAANHKHKARLHLGYKLSQGRPKGTPSTMKKLYDDDYVDPRIDIPLTLPKAIWESKSKAEQEAILSYVGTLVVSDEDSYEELIATGDVRPLVRNDYKSINLIGKNKMKQIEDTVKAIDFSNYALREYVRNNKQESNTAD
jgi:hypothetical protein